MMPVKLVSPASPNVKLAPTLHSIALLVFYLLYYLLKIIIIKQILKVNEKVIELGNMVTFVVPANGFSRKAEAALKCL